MTPFSLSSGFITEIENKLGDLVFILCINQSASYV